MAGFWSRQVEGVAHNLISNVIVAALGVGVALYIANRARLQGVPSYAVLLIAVAGFFLISISFAVIAWGIAQLKRKPANTADSSESTGGQSGVEQALIKSRAEVGNLEQQLTVLQSKSTEGEFLRVIARQDRQSIDKAVYVFDLKFGDFDYTSPTPFVDFRISVFNGSVFPISIGAPISGYISYGSRRLNESITPSSTWYIQDLPRIHTGTLEFRQGLSPEEAEYISRDPNTHNYHFSFEHLKITITGQPIDGVRERPVNFGCRGIRLNGTLA